MKVLMIAPQPFLEPRGTPISVYQRARGLAQLGHSVDLVTYHVGQDVTIPGVKVHRIPRVPLVNEVKVGPSWYKPFLDALVFYKAAVLLARNRYDVIHSHEEAAFFGTFLARVRGTRHLYDMHSSLPRQLANFNFGNYRPIVSLFELLERRVINSSDAMITIGADLERYVMKINPAAKQVMIENLPVQSSGGTIDQRAVEHLKERLGLVDKVPIVYTGTFERYQGVGLLLESAQIVIERCPQAAFVLVGGKPLQIEHWQGEAARLGLQSHVHFVGTVPLDEVQVYMEVAELLVSPRTEGTSVPLKIYTYLHSGKPMVATRLPAHTLVLDEDTAVLTEPTREAFAEGVLRLVQDPSLRLHIGRQAQKLAKEKYGPDNYMARLEWIYGTLQPSVPTAA